MLTRRKFIKVGLTGTSYFLLDGIAPTFAWADTHEPHFFLHLMFPGGFDASYLFDARPLAMTAAGLIQNYSGLEPMLWEGSNGVQTWATAKAEILRPLKDDITVINGVIMTPAFNGHTQNLNYLLTGNPSGGESFMPHLNHNASPLPLDGILEGEVYANQNNFSNFIPLSLTDAKTLLDSVKNKQPMDLQTKLWNYIDSRYAANGLGRGGFSEGVRKMQQALPEASRLEDLVRQVEPFEATTIPFMGVVGEFFKKGISRSAVLIEDLPLIDCHAGTDAKKCPAFAEKIATKIKDTLTYLKNTPYDSKRSLLDVTTVMYSSEFSRTMRQGETEFASTGTDHNNFGNSIVLAGKGIKGGQVIGQTDFRSATEVLSKAHLVVDDGKRITIGRPFDFATGRNREDLPETFDLKDYLSIGSVINTLYRSFGVNESKYRELDRNGYKAPLISTLLKP